MCSMQITSFNRCNYFPIQCSDSPSSTSVVATTCGNLLRKGSATCSLSCLGQKISKNALKLSPPGMSAVHHSTPVCLLGGEGKSKNDKKMASPWKALENIMGNSKKEPSVEDLLRKQIEKQEYFDDEDGGGNDGKGPDGGGGGDGFGDPGEESFSDMLDELIQVFLAVAGLIFLYVYILEGEEINTFTKDMIKFIFTRKKSLRLARLIDDWKSYVEEKSTVQEENPYWLEHAIISTPTWWDSPEKLDYIYKRHMAMAADRSQTGSAESISRSGSVPDFDSDSDSD